MMTFNNYSFFHQYRSVLLVFVVVKGDNLALYYSKMQILPYIQNSNP